MILLRLMLAALVLARGLSPACANAGEISPPFEMHEDLLHRPYRTQTFDVGGVTVDGAKLSIARRYFIARSTTLPALDAVLTCEITDQGQVDLRICEPGQATNTLNAFVLRIVRSGAIVTGLPTFPTLDRRIEGSLPVASEQPRPYIRDYAGSPTGDATPPAYRLARLAVHTEAIPAPQVDLETGRLVELGQLPAIASAVRAGPDRVGGDYPPRALRADKTGRQTIECQIQTDRSIICRGIAFDPSENAGFFTPVSERLFQRVLADERLTDGSSAVGVRFRFAINWQLPR